MKIVRESALAIFFQPVLVAKVRADFFDRGANRLLLFGE